MDSNQLVLPGAYMRFFFGWISFLPSVFALLFPLCYHKPSYSALYCSLRQKSGKTYYVAA